MYSTFVSSVSPFCVVRTVVCGAWILALALSMLLVSSLDAWAQQLSFIEVQRDGVGGVDGIDGASGIQISPDGLHVYVAGFQATGNAIAVFSRSPVTGALTFVEVQRDGVDGLRGARDVTISPDGKHVYVTGVIDDAVAVFSRDAATGALTFVEAVFDGVGGVDGLDLAACLTISPDGKHVYATGANDDALTVFSRDATTGTLTFVEVIFDGGSVQGLDFVFAVVISPDGKHVYTGSRDDNAIAVFSRDAATGALTFVEAVFDGVGGVDGLDGVLGVVVSPNGSHVYAASADDDAIAVFSRDAATGALTFVEVQRDGVGGVDGLDAANALALSPDGGFLYAAGDIDNAIALFSRDAATGALTFVEVQRDGVGGVDGLEGATEVATSPDGHNVYVSGNDEDAVAVFQHTPFMVANTNDSGGGSLRQALLNANAHPNDAQPDTIDFDINAQTDPGCDNSTGVCTIAVQSELPTITEAVVIDGETQAGADCGSGIPSRTLKIVVDGSAIGVSVNGFTVTGSGSTIRALVINQFQVIGTFQSGGIVLTGSGSVDNVIACNFIGTDVIGTLAQGNNLAGVLVDLGASNNTIGGTTPDAGNLISGNFTGVHITGSGTTGNRVQGNYIGTDAGGTIDLGNYTGVTINTASNNTIGGTVAGARNVISGNNDGVLITGNGTTGHQVQGNYIGTDAGGTIDLGNTQSGVVIVGSAANTIGGTAAGARNVISGNNIGVVIKGAFHLS